MPLTYDQDSRLKTLAPVLDEHAEWFGRITRQVFYPEKKLSEELLAIPDSFDKWAAEAQKDDVIEKESLARMKRVHGDMHQAASDLLKEVFNTRQKPDIAIFDAFTILYDEFVSHLRRLELEVAVSDSGLDPLTGLRTKQVMTKDIDRELERRARRGRAFCLALARIDHYGDVQKLPPDLYDKAIVDLGEIIKLCMRSFDDAYRLSDGEFLMCLKQTEMAGGTSGLNRLRKLMEERAPYYVLDGREVRLTMSSCVAEPQPGDTLDDLIANMRKDLDHYSGDNDTVLEYFEVSPLQRFVKDLNDDPGGKKPH